MRDRSHQACGAQGRGGLGDRQLGPVEVAGNGVLGIAVGEVRSDLHALGHLDGGTRLGLDQRRPRWRPLAEHLGEAGQHRSTLYRRGIPPARKGGLGRGDRRLGIGNRPVGSMAHHPGGVWIHDLVGGRRGRPLPSDEELPLLLRIDLGDLAHVAGSPCCRSGAVPPGTGPGVPDTASDVLSKGYRDAPFGPPPARWPTGPRPRSSGTSPTWLDARAALDDTSGSCRSRNCGTQQGREHRCSTP